MKAIIVCIYVLTYFPTIFWSLDEVVGDLRIHVRASVRTCVRTYATLLLENRSLLFSETLQLFRACKREKNVSQGGHFSGKPGKHLEFQNDTGKPGKPGK